MDKGFWFILAVLVIEAGAVYNDSSAGNFTGCGDVPEIEHGNIVLLDNSTFGSQANVTCDQGFVADKSNITCLSSGFWDNATCVRDGCSDIQEIENGYLVFSNNSTNGLAENVTCEPGFTAESSNITCGSSVLWDIIYCIRTGCGDVPEIEHGNIVLLDNSTFGSQANVTCDQGFVADKSNITCLTSGFWDNATCVRDGCSDVSDIENGYLVFSKNLTYGQEENVTCEPGFTAKSSNITCGSSVLWDIIYCIRTGCGDVPEIEHGNIVLLDNSTFGSQANVTCDQGFVADKSNITCLTSGFWDNATCVRDGCSDIPEIENGYLVFSYNSTNGLAENVTCESGFTAASSNITCNSSVLWDIIYCIRTDCGDLPEIEHGNIVLRDNSTFGSQANVTCDQGFVADKSNITCLTSGFWDNATCVRDGCSDISDIENGYLIFSNNLTYGQGENVTCVPGFTAESSNITCGSSVLWDIIYCIRTGCGDTPDISDGYIERFYNSTFGSEANVTCNNGFSADKSNITCLTSGYWENVTCIRIGCGEVPEIPNGYIDLYENSTYGSEANVTCEPGFIADKSNISCLTSGYWENAKCIRTGCGDVPEIANGFIVLFDNATVGSEANVTCDYGFYADKTNITCLASGYWDNVTCVRQGCGDVPDIPDGYIDFSGNSTFGSEANVTCYFGFTANKSNITCLTTGYWDNVTCIRIGCGDVPEIANGFIDLFDNATVGSEANVTCDNGFYADKTNITCLASGNWDNVTCVRQGCGDVPDIPDGYIDFFGNSTFGSEANVTCDSGFTANKSNIACLTSGYWDNVTCIRKDCGDVPEIEHGNITLFDNSTYGSKAYVSCEAGYTAEHSNITCLSSGNWNNVTCMITGCGDTPEIADGNIDAIDNSSFGSQAHVTCDSGFTADKSNVTCLTSGFWDNATCIRTGCGVAPKIENGYVDVSDNSTFGSEAGVTCDSGFTADKSKITCLTSGHWENVTCVRTGCGDVPAIADGYIEHIDNSTFGSETNVTCDVGFTADKSNITCLTSGYWENVTCIRKDCGNVPEIGHGNITLFNNSTYGSQAYVSCDLGYTAEHSNITCLSSGNWDNASCIRTGCGETPEIADGMIEPFDDYSFGSQANVTCDPGFTADKSNVTCLTSGFWDNVTCIRTGCGVAPKIENGYVDISNNSIFGSEAKVTCDSGFTADKSKITCLTSGYWENVTCVRTGCGDAPEIEDGFITLSEISIFGSEANVTCDIGFTADKSNITCLTSGNWENVTCEKIDCGDVPEIEHGNITLFDDSTYGSKVDVSCDMGYTADQTNITCLLSGNWENVTCFRTGCGEVPEISGGYIVPIDNFSFGSQANVTCEPGFTADKLNVTCLTSGFWDNATCIRTGCGFAPEIKNGYVDLSDNSTFGSEADVTCDSGFTADKSYITCRTSGYWENVTCVRTGCGNAPEIEDGFITLFENSTFGSKANVTCDIGFTADKSNITCLTTGNWENVTCVRIDCGDVPRIDHGNISLVDDSTYGSQADVSCDMGYTPDRSNITCLLSGNWGNVTCLRTGCGEVPEISGGYIVPSHDFSFGAQADLTCDKGFTADKSNVTCLTSGFWDNATCIRTGCADVPDIADGYISVLDDSIFGSEANVTCDPGFVADNSSITCLTSGIWENVTCRRLDCGDVSEIEHGNITVLTDTKFGSHADVTCESAYTADNSTITCLTSGNWSNTSCIRTGCGDVSEIEDGNIVLVDKSNFGSQANVICNPGFVAEQSSITCLTSGNWDNVTCIRTECSIDILPSIANGEVMIDTDGNQTTASVVNVSCNTGYAATSPVIGCQGQGQWQNNVLCVAYALGGVTVETGQDIRNGQYTGYLKCGFTIVDGLQYRIKWYVNGRGFYDTEVITSTQASLSVLTDDMFSESVLNHASFSQFFTLQVMCSAAVYDGAGETDLENDTSTEITPLRVSTNSITILRGKEATFTVSLNFPFGCSTDSQDCFLRFIVYDPDDFYRCSDSTIAIIHSDTCGGKVEGATPATLNQLSTTNTFTNITITTKNNRWYRLRSQFSLVLKLAANGNSKALWNSPSTTVSVTVTENYDTKYRGCYSFVDPYIYTFDRRWYSNQLLEEFVLFRHKTLPIEVQTITAPCNGWATCSCAVTVRAGGDVFTINHCSGHLSTFLSANDGILKVYRLWSTYFQIILPTGMNVYVYVMSYMNYMMNVYITPTPSDFEQMEGLCGNFNGNFSDDTILRGTTQSDPVESSYGYWRWWSEYFFPHTFAYSWGLVQTGRQDESLLNSDVYDNVESWDSNKKLCVCPNANTGNDYTAICSADEEATCTSPVWRWGTRIEAQTRKKRDVDSTKKKSKNFDSDVKKRLQRMRRKWEALRDMHTALRKKREVNNSTTISIEKAKQMCTEELNSNCNTYSKKDDVSDVAESNDTLENCARDTAISGTTEWVTPHCDAITQKVTVEIEKDVEFAENNTDLVDNIVENSCPSNCSGHGQCVNQTCVCFQDFGTDLCLLNLTLGPLIEELADEGICDVSTGNECDYILIVGNGFVETAKCNLTVYVAGTDGNFNMTEQFEVNCTYTTFNELFAQVPEITNSSEDTNATLIARMYEISVSNDGVNFGSQETVVVLDTTCQQRQTSADNETIVTLKSGYCYIAGICFTAGTYLTGSSCAKCDTSQNLFVWTDGCNNDDDTNKNYLIIIGGCVGGAIFVIAVGLAVYCYMKAKAANAIKPLVAMSSGPSKMRFWSRKGSNVVEPADINPGKKLSAAKTSQEMNVYP